MAISPGRWNYKYMSYKIIPLVTGEFYHVYNRSIAKELIFDMPLYLKHALNTVEYYRFPQKLRFSAFKKLLGKAKVNYINYITSQKPLVEIYAFALMPNHFHFQLKQNREGGIAKFLSNFQNSFAKCFNTINNRDGSLFQDSFKSRIITSIDQFIHVSRYIHLNPITSSLVKYEELKSYPLTSYSWYANPNLNRFIEIDIILNHFKSFDKYDKFMRNQANYQKKLRMIKRLLID